MSHSTPLFDNDGVPSTALLELLTLFDVRHDGTVTGIRNATQDAWYQSGKLRAEIAERHGEKREAAQPLFQQLGFIDEVRARQQQYFHCVLLGATVVGVRKRLAFLISEWERGVRFANLVFLGSNRVLLKDKESPAVLVRSDNAELPIREGWTLQGDLPTTEIEMMRMVYTQARFPTDWVVSDHAIFVSPNITDRNANTRDTLKLWGGNKTHSTLLVSSQPFVSYQRVVAEQVLRLGVNPDCIGYSAPGLPVTTYLDNVAKIVFELAEEA